MKKKVVALLIGVCSLVMAACGAKDADSEVSALTPTKVDISGTTQESTVTVDETDSAWIGTWYETKLGMEMNVTKSGNGYKYVVNWPDPANHMTFVWEITGSENEAGVIYYSEGVASVIEEDESGKETTSILSDHERGSFALLYDGTLQWIEEVEVEVEHSFVREGSVVKADGLTDEQAVEAIKKYCLAENPDLAGIVEDGQYAVYWDVLSSDENQVVVVYRSYTGAQKRFYIERSTGDTKVAEFVPAIQDEEEMTDERLNVNDYK